MKVLLVLNNKHARDVRILVKLQTKCLREEVITLLEKNKGKEAFDLIISKAMVEDYIPLGTKLVEKPQLTLIEDLL